MTSSFPKDEASTTPGAYHTANLRHRSAALAA